MLNPTTTSSIRVLPNNKVYRQLFEAQVQLSDSYKRVRENQLTQSLNITTRPSGIPLVKNIRPHEAQKRQWLTSKSFSYNAKTDPITLLYHEEKNRHENEQKQELIELKREVFNLPDEIEYLENEQNENKKESLTERLATSRQTKFTALWTDLLNKIIEANQTFEIKVQNLTRKCNHYYEQGDKEIHNELQNLIYQKEITTLKIKSFEQPFRQFDEILPTRLAKIQDYCQLIEELECERIDKIRNLFKSYSDQLYKTHHLSEQETALQLEKQANELNKQILENRRVYAELEARLLAGETVRIHRYQGALINYQEKWRDTIWGIHKQAWISKLLDLKSKLESTILSSCESIGSDVYNQTRLFISHINSLNSFIPPTSTRTNAQTWYEQGQDIIKRIVDKRQQLVQAIREILNKELNYLQKDFENRREDILTEQIYTKDQIQTVFEQDIQPLFNERKQFLQESILDRTEIIYEQLTNHMYDTLDRLLAFIQPTAEQWDEHQTRLDHVTVQLNDLMREARRPFDIQNEKKSAKLDTTLDDMRSASNEKTLTRLLTSIYEQLDAMKISYTQFYDMEHNLVNKYSDMITEEVNRYRTEMLEYFHARKMDSSKPILSSSHQYYTTKLAKTTYELEGYAVNGSNLTQQISTNKDDDEVFRFSPTRKPSSDEQSHLKSLSYDQDQSEIQTFLTEDPRSTSEIIHTPFVDVFRIPSNLVDILMLNLCRNFLDYYDQWKDETIQRANTLMFSKHEELKKEMDFQLQLHEPRRVRIEIDIHNVRAAELVMHDERVERHIRGVQEILEQTDADYVRMLNQFTKSVSTYTDDVHSLEQLFLNATSSNRLLTLENRLLKQRDQFMDNIRISLKKFRQHFDEIMLYLRQANIKFRKALKSFSEGGNFCREEIETHRKKLEKLAYQIDQAESALLKELEKLEKKQLDEANRIMNQFRERFQNHQKDLEFIELTNRWISEAQVKIKSEVAFDNQQAQTLKTLVEFFDNRIDSIVKPNFDKQTATLMEIRELFKQIVLMTYERALYLKCLNNELSIPTSIIPILRDKGLISEELVRDLRVTEENEGKSSSHPSRMSASQGSNNDEMKSVRFASSSSPTTIISQHKKVSIPLLNLMSEQTQQEDTTTILTIRTLLHHHKQMKSDEMVEEAKVSEDKPDSSFQSSRSKKAKKRNKKTTDSDKDSRSEKDVSAFQHERPGHSRNPDSIYILYCTFGEKKHLGQDFLSKILNILRDSTEGLLSHSELYYKEKGSRPVTRPQALREKFDEFAEMMIEKLKHYEQQCRTYREQCINEFRTILEFFERTSSLIAKIEFDQEILQAENTLYEYLQQFHLILNEKLNQSKIEKETNFELLRPSFANPARRNHLTNIDQREKRRQDDIDTIVNRLRLNTMEDVQTNAQNTVQSLATNAERLLILFDDILTSDDIIRTKVPLIKQPLLELIRRQQAGKPLDDAVPSPIIERKQGHWSGLPLLKSRRSSSVSSKKRSASSSQRQKRSASVVTQKTTLPQIETIKQRDQAYQRFKHNLNEVLTDIDNRSSSVLTDLDRYRIYWNESIEKVQNLRMN